MRVILETPDGRRLFEGAQAVIAADTAAEVPAALAAVEAALAQGRHVAGWLGYELGYALEPRLVPLLPPGVPLLRLGVFGPPREAVPPPRGRAYAGPLRPEWDEAAYRTRFAGVKALIAAGDIYQANLSFRSRFAFAGDAQALYERLRTASAAGHCAFVEDGARAILSLSPELFFEISVVGEIVSRPMKGTMARAGDDDAAERAALAASPKERAENLMIADLIRNDLGRVARTGSVAATLFAVETYPAFHAMVSTVRAVLRPGTQAGEILKALFPCGSVTGAPKIRAMEVLRGCEASPRGAYCGAVGVFAPDGSARFNVAIRTLTITGSEGELGLGGGVVQDSQGAAEYAECLLKARFFEDGRRPLELIETLRWDGGFVRLESHLARLAASAPVFGLVYDDAAARAALAAAVAGRAGPLRVRLTLDEAGRLAASAHALAPDPAFWTWRLSSQRVESCDLLLRHKTSWRDLYEQEAWGADEVLFCNERGELTEGARSNIFVARDGVLLTPPLAAGVLDGRLRAELIVQGRAREAVLRPPDLEDATVFCGNSLRGLIAARPV